MLTHGLPGARPLVMPAPGIAAIEDILMGYFPGRKSRFDYFSAIEEIVIEYLPGRKSRFTFFPAIEDIVREYFTGCKSRFTYFSCNRRYRDGISSRP